MRAFAPKVIMPLEQDPLAKVFESEALLTILEVQRPITRGRCPSLPNLSAPCQNALQLHTFR